MKVNILYLLSRGRNEVEDVIDMFAKDPGPIKFNLIEHNDTATYFKIHKELKRISLDDFDLISSTARKELALNEEEIIVLITNRNLESPAKKLKSIKDWYSFYLKRNIIVKCGIWDEITEGKPYLGIAHQIIENLFQNLSMINLNSDNLSDSIHMDTEVCINDYCETINEAKAKIRSGYICRSCTEKINEFCSQDYIIQIKNILKRISDRVRENYEFILTDEQLKVQINENYDLFIGEQKIDFGPKEGVSKVVYLFYLINSGIQFGKKEFKSISGGSIYKEKYKELYRKVVGYVDDSSVESYIKSMTSYHSRISTRLKNQLTIEAIAHRYRFQSVKIEQDVTVYYIDVDRDKLSMPKDLHSFRIS